MRSTLLSFSFGLPLTALILDSSCQFFLLGVYRNHWLARSQILLDPLIDVLELRVPVRVVGPFTALAHTLQTVTHFGQQIANRTLADRVSRLGQSRGQLSRTLGSPTQR